MQVCHKHFFYQNAVIFKAICLFLTKLFKYVSQNMQNRSNRCAFDSSKMLPFHQTSTSLLYQDALERE